MASTRYIRIVDENCSTEDKICFSFDVGVTNATAGNYYVRYQVGSKSKVTTSTFYMAAGEETTIGPYDQSGLSANTTYTVNASLVVAANNTVVATAQAQITTAEPAFQPPTIIIPSGTCSSTSDSVTIGCRVSAPSSGKFYVEFAVSYLGMSQSHTSSSFSLSDDGSRDLTWTFGGIPSRTSVSVRVEVRDYSTDELYDYDTTSVSTSAPPWPGDWDWSSTVSRGSQIPYTRSGNVVTCTPLTATEWNRFVDRVIDVREYLNIPAGNMSALYVTKGSSFNADVLEAMRQVIDSMGPKTDVPSAISSGSRITAAFVNGLKYSLNSLKGIE